MVVIKFVLVMSFEDVYCLLSTAFLNMAQFSSVSPLARATCCRRLEISLCMATVMQGLLIFQTAIFYIALSICFGFPFCSCQFLHQCHFPESFAVHGTDVGRPGKFSDLLFNTLLFDLTHSKHHVYGTAARTEATLGFRQVALRDAGDEPLEEDASQAFPALESREIPL